jgi:eukaryotic-like serine/threonine-protein kinase
MDDVILNPGEIICDGRYEILHSLGQGGMGIVYKARSLALKRDVAIKMLTHLDDDLRKRLLLEGDLLAKVDHDAVVKIYDFVESSPQGPMLVLEYVPGRDLTSVLGKPMDISEAVDLLLAICSGVVACHRLGIVHRDLKPGNIRLVEGTDWRSRVRILDFGIAIPYDSPIIKARQARMTQTGVVVGTPCFIAPELLRHEEPDDKCDQYGLAILLYMLLTGREPFPNLDGKELVQAILQGNYLSPRFLRHDIPAELERIIVRALDTDPRKRFDSVVDFAFALLPFASTKAGSYWNQIFTNARRPVPRELLGAVSAANPVHPVVPLAKRIEVIDGPKAPPRPQPPTVVDPIPPPARRTPPALTPSPAEQAAPSPGQVRAGRRPGRSEAKATFSNELLRGYVKGLIIGAAGIIVVVLAYLIFQPK